MEDYTVDVEYEVEMEYNDFGKLTFVCDFADLLIYDKTRTKLIISQTLTQKQCKKLVKNINNNNSKEIEYTISLSELYFKVYCGDNILEIGVSYGGPSIFLKIIKPLKNALIHINESYMKGILIDNRSHINEIHRKFSPNKFKCTYEFY